MTFEFVVGAVINEVTEHPNYVCSKETEEVAARKNFAKENELAIN